METLPTTYTLRAVQKQGWNLEIGVFSSDGDLRYIGKPAGWSHDFAIRDAAGSLLVTGKQRRAKPFYIWSFALMREGYDVCVIRPDRLFSRKVFFNFADGSRVPFWRPWFGDTFIGTSNTGWRYEAGPYGHRRWDVSIWELPDDLVLLSALIYLFQEEFFSSNQ